MIKLKRTDFYEIAKLLVLANTSNSFYTGMLKTNTVQRLRKELNSTQTRVLYQALTARAKRTEFSISLAYAALISTILNYDNVGNSLEIDGACLYWGEEIKMFAQKETPTSLIILASGSTSPHKLANPSLPSSTISNSRILIGTQ